MRIKTFFQKSFAVTLSLAMCLSMYSIVFAADVSVKEVEYANNADETLFLKRSLFIRQKLMNGRATVHRQLVNKSQ